jgi:arylsulfatase A-like enzyme/Flp pilus assembly protein TadD
LAAGLAGVLLLTGCARRADHGVFRPGGLKGANVLLVTIDTLRRDRVGAYGNRSGLTPTLDKLSGQGLRFSHAYSHVPLTLPAHTSILTGLTPRRHGVRNNTTFRLDDKVPTLATVLRDAGYRTGAFIGAFVLDARFGLNRGFDEYNDRLPHSDRASFRFAERRAAEVVKLAGDWILRPSTGGSQNNPQPWFAWVHLYDPHAPYDAPAEYRPGRAPYDAEVAYTDAMLGQLVDRLRSSHPVVPTLIVVTADHGESLGEHGETTHGLFAYDATIAVPLIITATGSSTATGSRGAATTRSRVMSTAGDGVVATTGSPSTHNGTEVAAFDSSVFIRPAVVDTPVAHMDIVPTILDLAGVRTPDGLDGQSLVNATPRDRPLYFEALDAYLTRNWAPLSGVVQDGWKYIDLPLPELYDLSADPHEERNEIGSDPRGDSLRRMLQQLQVTRQMSPPRATIDQDAAARLRSLGYVGPAAPIPQATARRRITEADDPKRLVGLNERFNSALTAFDEGRSGAALADFLAILEDRPDFVAARTSAATVLLQEGRSRDAVSLLRAAPPDQAESGELLARLGAALWAAGDLRSAVAALEHARRSGNQNPELLNDLAVVYAALGRGADARAMFHELLTLDPASATAWYNLGLFELQANRPEEAAGAFQHAVELEPGYGVAWQALGAALVRRDRLAAADAWRHAERLLPGDYDLLFNLAMVLADGRKPTDAIPYLRRFAAEAPRDRYADDLLRVRAILSRLERSRS